MSFDATADASPHPGHRTAQKRNIDCMRLIRREQTVGKIRRPSGKRGNFSPLAQGQDGHADHVDLASVSHPAQRGTEATSALCVAIPEYRSFLTSHRRHRVAAGGHPCRCTLCMCVP